MAAFICMAASVSMTAYPQSGRPAADATISGTVTVDGKPEPGISVLLLVSDDPNVQVANVLGGPRLHGNQIKRRSVTDSTGHYAFRDLTAGKYMVFPFDPVRSIPVIAGIAPSLGKPSPSSLENR